MNKIPEKTETEVVKIRLGSDDKVRLQEIADMEVRTFAGQCQLALHEWLESNAR